MTDVNVSTQDREATEPEPETGPDGRADARSARSLRRMSAAARSRAATRERLLASGRRLFASRGVAAVTSHRIAREAQVAAGTFYLHFPDKRALFREIALEALAELRARLFEATRPASDVRSGVPLLARALVDFAEENRDLIRILFRVEADAARVQSDFLSELARSIADGRRERIQAGEMPPEIHPEILSQALVGMWARVIAWWVDDPDRTPRETVIETLTRIQLSGTHPAGD